MPRTGRPPLDPHDTSVHLGCRVTSRQYDALAQLALQHRVSVAALTRLALRRLLKAADVPPRQGDE